MTTEPMADGWVVSVPSRGSRSGSADRMYVVALSDRDAAVRAVESEIGEALVDPTVVPVEARLLTLRSMAAGEVRLLGARRS